MTKDDMVEELADSYGCYLDELSKEELQIIINSNYFTLREARQYEQWKRSQRAND